MSLDPATELAYHRKARVEDWPDELLRQHADAWKRVEEHARAVCRKAISGPVVTSRIWEPGYRLGAIADRQRCSFMRILADRGAAAMWERALTVGSFWEWLGKPPAGAQE